MINKTMKFLSSIFEVRDLGEADCFSANDSFSFCFLYTGATLSSYYSVVKFTIY